MLVSNCIVCDKEFKHERRSKKTCSDACRRKLSRRKKARKDAVSDRVTSVGRVLETLDRMLKSDDYRDMSYEIMTAFKTISQSADNRLDDTSLVWECLECGTIKYQTLPVPDGCYCPDGAQWWLQKKMI